MNTVPAILGRFQSAILDNAATLAVQDIKPGGHMDVYVEGYRIRLVQAVRMDYPALLSLLGEQEFTRLARAYVEATPSISYNLDRYSLGFADFVTHNVKDKFACELATLENAITQVFMEEESKPLAASFLSQLTPESFAAMTLQHRLASRLLSFQYPVNAWLDAERAGNVPPPPALRPEFIYAYRHNNTVQRIPLSEPAYLFLEQAVNKPVGEALEHTISAHPEYETEILENIQPWFADWLAKGFFRTVIKDS